MSAANGHGAEPPKAEALLASVKTATRKGSPPVHLWNPPFCGNLDMQIRRNGTWIHEGGEIRRPELVRLFASILKREGDDYFLVTPVEKVGIEVEDAPFVAIDFEVEREGDSRAITFETNVGDFAVAGSENPIRVVQDPVTGEPSPYIHIRRGLEALIDRKSFYRLAEIAEIEMTSAGGHMVVRSLGQTFTIGPAT